MSDGRQRASYRNEALSVQRRTHRSDNGEAGHAGSGPAYLRQFLNAWFIAVTLAVNGSKIVRRVFQIGVIVTGKARSRKSCKAALVFAT